jgi:hypothetical protein
MRIKPMLDDYELPGLQRIGTLERRALVDIPVPGLEGDYHQDLGSGAVSIVIEGTLSGDEARDGFLTQVRERFSAGEPVDFVADITTATELEQVHLEDLRVHEVAGRADSFRYRLVLTQFVPPPPPDLFGDLGDLEAALDLEALDLLAALEIPDLLASIPEFTDPTPPLRATLDGVRSALTEFDGVGGAITELFG